MKLLFRSKHKQNLYFTPELQIHILAKHVKWPTSSQLSFGAVSVLSTLIPGRESGLSYTRKNRLGGYLEVEGIP